jgi:hypothetical protein
MAARSYEGNLVVDREHRVLARIALADHSSSKTNIENDRDRCSRRDKRIPIYVGTPIYMGAITRY